MRSDAWFQILMYCEILLLSEPGKTVRPGIYPVRDISSRGFSDKLVIGSARDGKTIIEDYATVREEYAAMLKAVLETIFSPASDFVMTGDYRICENCPYRQLCNR